MKTGIIFDLDGTLWDSSEEVAVSWNEAIGEAVANGEIHAGTVHTLFAGDIRGVMGLTMDEIAEKLFFRLPDDAQKALMQKCIERENAYVREHGGKLLGEVEDVLMRLQQTYPLYIVSNSQSGYVEAFLEHFRFAQYFSDFECFGNTGHGKADNIRLIAERNFLDRFYYVGDTKGDYDATVEAGGRFIHAAYGFGEVPQSTAMISNIAELPAYLKQNDNAEQPMKLTEYSIPEMAQFVRMTEAMYDVVRIVDPIECRLVHLEGENIRYGSECYEVWDASHRCKDCSSYRACMSGGRDEKNELQKGDLYHIQSNPVALRIDGNNTLPCVIEFITKRPATDDERSLMTDRRMEERQDFHTTLDSLTGLYNKESFFMNARKLMIAHPEEAWLFCVADIRQFKLVNSLFGREKCNRILIEIAEIFRSYEDEKTIFARIQGDQFGIFIPKSRYKEEPVLEGLERVRKLLADSNYTLIMQMGIYEVTDRNIAVNMMYDRALTALLTIHGDDRETIRWFDDSLLQNIMHRHQVLGAFDEALAAGEFCIYLQPQIGNRTQVEGGEALVRWRRPDGSIVPPMEFIPTLEEAGLIVKLDTYVWELAAKQLEAWKGTEFEKYYISVNISPMDFYYIDVYEAFTDLVNRYALDRKKLKLEITESVLMSDAERQISRVKHLRDSGFYLEIDDFGSGYSSLAMLKDIEVDVLKIDMEFLRETEHAARSREILRSVIDMAKNLGVDVITEGVETEAQLTMLQEMGCDNYQGYYFSKPLPVPEFEKYVREHR